MNPQIIVAFVNCVMKNREESVDVGTNNYLRVKSEI